MQQPQTMRGKTVIVTGANSGIGKATALGLASMGGTVVMACRDRARGEAALSEICAATKSSSVHLLILDLATQESVRSFAREFFSRYRRLDVLINNAGVIKAKRKLTPDGVMETFAINYLSPFLLTNLLLPRLVASAPSRVVNITSSMHFSGHIDFKDLQIKKHYQSSTAYAQSKLAQLLFTYELARRLAGTGVTVNAVHPGAVPTNLGRSDAGLLSLVSMVSSPFLANAEKGAETPMYVASAPELQSVTGKYFVDKRQQVSSHESYDEVEAKQLWDVSMKLTKLAKAT